MSSSWGLLVDRRTRIPRARTSRASIGGRSLTVGRVAAGGRGHIEQTAALERGHINLHRPRLHFRSMRDSFVARARRFAVAGIAVAGALASSGKAQTPSAGSLKYPSSPRGGQLDDVGGVRVADPYRWLENLGAPDVRSWVAAQSSLTEWYLSQIPRRKEIQDLMTREWNYTKLSAPFATADRLFYFENAGLENQSVLYMHERTESTPRAIIDANRLSSEGLIAVVGA